MTSPPPTDPRQQLLAEIGHRQRSLGAAQFDIGRAVTEAARTGSPRPASPQIDAELARIGQAQQAIGQLEHQLRQLDAEPAADPHAAADPAAHCPACRNAVVPGQRYCTTCGEKLQLGAPVGEHTSALQAVHAVSCRRCGRDVAHDVAYCARCGWRVALSPVRFYRAKWPRLLLAGLLVYIFCSFMVRHLPGIRYAEGKSFNPALLMAQLIIGASLVPVVFVMWFYERGSRDQTPLGVLITTFLGGAVLGCTLAVALENAIHLKGDWGYIPVGFIEEGSKIALVLVWLRRKDLLRADKGMVIGAATGMGFAALETMQYGLVAFLTAPRGTDPVHELTSVLNVRGVLAPLGHGTWTGILAAVIWFERANGRRWYGPRAVAAYVFVALMHAMYDITIGAHVGLISIFGSEVGIFGILFGLAGLATMFLIVRATRRGKDPVSAFFDGVSRLAGGGGTAWAQPGWQQPPGSPQQPQGYPPQPPPGWPTGPDGPR